MDYLLSGLEFVSHLAVDIPDPAPQAPEKLNAAVGTIIGIVKWVGIIAGVLGLIAGGIMISISGRQGDGHEILGRIGKPLLGVAIVVCAVSIISLFF